MIRRQHEKVERRLRRRRHIRKKVFGTAEQPRMSVFRSLKNISVQLIDDLNGKTLCAAGTNTKALRDQIKNGGGNKEAAAIVGQAIAEQARMKGIRDVAFDRNGYRYHGRIKALADAARKTGLKF